MAREKLKFKLLMEKHFLQSVWPKNTMSNQWILKIKKGKILPIMILYMKQILVILCNFHTLTSLYLFTQIKFWIVLLLKLKCYQFSFFLKILFEKSWNFELLERMIMIKHQVPIRIQKRRKKSVNFILKVRVCKPMYVSMSLYY